MKHSLIGGLIAIIFVLSACSDNDDFNISSGIPEIIRLSNNITFPTDTLFIFGKNFPLKCDSCHIVFNDSIKIYQKDCVFWKANSIAVLIGDSIKTGKFYVVFGKDTSQRFDINVLPYPPFQTVIIRAGSFKMGSATGFEDELPIRTIHITRDLLVSKYEITQRLYEYIMKSNPSPIKHTNLPVYSVDWIDAIDFCNKLSEKDGLKKVYVVSDSIVSLDTNANGWRLPTEAEWEYLARAGALEDAPADLSRYAWFVSNSGGVPKFVGQKLANSFGLYDMLGNVSEWCWDYYAEYKLSDTINPRNDYGNYRVHRGGCFLDEKANVRFSSRRSNYNFAGIRLVRNK